LKRNTARNIKKSTPKQKTEAELKQALKTKEAEYQAARYFCWRSYLFISLLQGGSQKLLLTTKESISYKKKLIHSRDIVYDFFNKPFFHKQ